MAGIIDRVKERFPRLRRGVGFVRTLPLRLAGPERAFTRVYRLNAWKDSESASGPGSNLAQTEAVREVLPALLARLGCRTMLDAPCGDFHWMKEVPLDLELYIGGDIVDGLIRETQKTYGRPDRVFRKLNIISDPLPRADLVLCRDCLVHLSFKDAVSALRNLARSGSTYLLTTTHVECSHNRDIVTGQWRPLNLARPPFHFPEPIELFNERYSLADGKYRDKSLGLWRIADLPPL